MRLNLDLLLIIVLCVVTAGLAVSSVCDALGRPYLFVVRGTRSRLRLARGISWLGATAGSVISWIALIHLLPEFLALTTFFGFEAMLLEICGQRILYLAQATPRALLTNPLAVRRVAGPLRD